MRKDGSRFRAAIVIDAVRDAAGEVTGFTMVTRDVTQSDALRAATAESGSIAQTLVDDIVDYAIYLLDTDGCVKSWHAGAQRLTGFTADEIVGRHFRTFYSDDALRAGEPNRALCEARETGQHRSEGWRVRKDRTRFWASVTIDAVRDTAGTVVGFAKITRDVTQSVALEYVGEQLRIGASNSWSPSAVPTRLRRG